MADNDKHEIAFEALKVGMRQSRDGINITLALHPDDVHPGLMADPIGSRYQVRLVRIGDDEQPVPRRSELNMAGLVGQRLHEQHKETALRQAQRNLVASAGILCRDKAFQKWMFMEGISFEESEDGAVEGLHSFLNIRSRVQLAQSDKARREFFALRKKFEDAQELAKKAQEPR